MLLFQDPDLHAAASREWNKLNDRLTKTLRALARGAVQDGRMTQDDVHSFFMSGTLTRYVLYMYKRAYVL